MKLRVIKNGYYVSEDLTNLGMVDQDTLDMSISHFLVIGDIWEKRVYEEDNYEYFTCIEGKWKDEDGDGWWEYEMYEDYFEVIE